MLETARPDKLFPTRSRVSRHRHYSLLIVRGDGRLVFRVNFPRPVALGTGLSLIVGALAVTLLVGDWVQLRVLTREARVQAAELAGTRRVIENVNRRIGELQQEATAWQALHARIWQAIGPEGTGSRAGIGGRAEPAPRPMPVTGLERLAETVMEEGENLRALDRVMARAGRILASLPMRWPVRGDVNSEFGTRTSPWTGGREYHTGIDIGARQGTPVHAPAGGTVEFAGAHREYGLTVVLDHGQDVRTVYGHLSSVASRRGQIIERGTLLGHTGNTGRSSGPHLHYEVLVKGRPVNPRAYLWD